MKRDTPQHTLYLDMPARDVLDFMIRTEAILFNAVWHLRTPYDEAQTHRVYCELRQGDVVQARVAIAAAVDMNGGIGKRWHLLPDRPRYPLVGCLYLKYGWRNLSHIELL